MGERHAEFEVSPLAEFRHLSSVPNVSCIVAAYSVSNNEELKSKLLELEESLQDEKKFKDFYTFIFPFAKTKTQKSMDVDVSASTVNSM
jgi:hypothetical protein